MAAAWFTRGRKDRPRVLLARSSDAGRTFGPPVIVAGPAGGSEPLGRAGVAILQDGAAAVTWIERLPAGRTAEIRIRRLPLAGPPDPPFSVARTAPSRASGVPVVCPSGDGLLVAWTEPGADPRVRAARLKPSLPD